MNNLNAYEVSDVFRTNMDRYPIHKRDRNMKVLLKNQAITVCKNIISERYITNAINTFHSGYVYKDLDGHIIGFCIWKIKTTEFNKSNDHPPTTMSYLQLLLICSKDSSYKLGGYMLNDIDNYCIDNHIDGIELEVAHDGLIDYYRKFGYVQDTMSIKKMVKKPLESITEILRDPLSKTNTSFVSGKIRRT